MGEQLSPPALSVTLPVPRWRKRRALRARALSASALDSYVAQGYLNVKALEQACVHPRTRLLQGVALQQTRLVDAERHRLAAVASLAAELRDHYPGVDIDLIQSRGGRFEVLRDGKPIFEKSKLGRHVKPGEIRKLLDAQPR